jgi:Kef-type K+ transport system membrane component KefB/nucleotide-binding universal stress UspA family protein
MHRRDGGSTIGRRAPRLSHAAMLLICPSAISQRFHQIARVLLVAGPFCLIPAASVFGADNPSRGPSEVIFLSQIIALLVCGRLMGELMQRIGQPPVMGQLIAGILLGPSVLGALWPALQHALFPVGADQKAMIDAVAQLGILLLLLLTGMETDLAVVRRSRGAAFSVSMAGIVVPFLCGVLLGELLPDWMLPNPEKRLITTLFLGIALSISSVKIVAMVVREVGFLRRTVGQVIVASAIIDDTIGWIIMSVIFGLALHGGINLPAVAQSVVGTAIFLLLSFTIGRRLVFHVIRWANDRFVSEVPVITAILVVTGLMALTTNAIGVHTVLGAFVAGILVGQSPILTRHIDEQLRGLIVALFMPVFFGLAGLTTNLAVLANPDLLLLPLGLIAIASIGKFSGAFLGGRLGGMSWAQSLALGCGMNARGSTEVIIATIGLSMGVLNESLFTTIVAMAVVTTMSMPPMLRWALARLPLSPEEAARLEREEFEAKGFVPNIERVLVAVDASPSGQLTSRLVGLLAGARRIPTTVIHFDYETPGLLRERTAQAERTKAAVRKGAEEGDDASPEEPSGDRVEIATRVEKPSEEVIGAEAKKGYGLLFIGREPASEGDTFHEQITRSAVEFGGPFAIAIARGIDRENMLGTRLKILVPVTGTTVSRQGAELAIALAQASQGSVTALHVASGQRRARSWQRHIGAALAPATSEEAIIREIVRLGDHYGVEVRGAVRSVRTPQDAILRQLDVGGHNLLVMGVSPRPGDQLFFGQVPAELLERAECSVLFVAGEPPTPEPEPGKTPAAVQEHRAARFVSSTAVT